ncbi:MAG: sigma-70 family RNA polymerase sigma factor [Pyrinomonadaceae bacterium]
MSLPCADITQLLIDWSEGDTQAMERLFPLVEQELHRLAHYYMSRFRPGNTLQTTAVINEGYLRLIDQNRVSWQNRAHFYGIAAQMMRRAVLNYIRDQKRLKRGGGVTTISLSEFDVILEPRSDELLALDDALDRLEQIDKRKAQVVEMRYFGGLSVEETAHVLRVSKITVMRDWRMARAWLFKELSPDGIEG